MNESSKVSSLLSIYERTGMVNVSESLRSQLKAKLDELGSDYTERYDSENKIYVFMEREDKLI